MSRFYRAGVVVVLALFALACNNGDDSSGTPNQPPSFNNTVLMLAPPADGSGDVYVGGDFTTYDGAQAIRIVRLMGMARSIQGLQRASALTAACAVLCRLGLKARRSMLEATLRPTTGYRGLGLYASQPMESLTRPLP